MTFPLKLLNRLHLGRPIAAQVKAVRPQYRAWIHVRPVVDPEKGRLVSTGGGDDRIEHIDGNPIVGYLVGQLEIHERFLDGIISPDAFLKDGSTQERIMFAPTDRDLEQILSRLLPDLNLLRLPDDVGYPLSNAFGPIFSGVALRNAACTDDRLLVQMLLDAGADIDLKTPPGITALRVVAGMGAVEMVRFLLDKGANVDARSSQGTTLTWAASAGRTELVHLLLDRGADVSALDDRGRTSLYWAAEKGNTKMVIALLAKGANVNAGVFVFTPTEAAINNVHRETVSLLKKAGGKASWWHIHRF